MKLSILVCSLVLSAGAAFAGPGDTVSPVPGASALFTVPGVIHTAKMATVVSCTNMSKSSTTLTMGVQVFDHAGTSLDIQSFLLSGGASVVVSTTSYGSAAPVLSLTADFTLNVPEGAAGALRVLSSKKDLVCSAMNIDRLNDPPSTSNALPVLTKGKQKGA